MGNLLNMSGGSLLEKGLPYDAEIEYLESTGTQYIDTGFVPSTTTRAECAFRGTFNNKRLFGCRVAYQNNQFDVILYDTVQYGLIIRRGVASQKYFRPVEDNTYYVLSMGKNTYTINGDTFSYTTGDYNTVYPLLLFCLNGGGVADLSTCCTAKMYYFKLYNDNTLVRDFIPVRVGQVGYLYDKVSKQLFGNSGTGDFILGPDKQ